ncbi:hypothetical protein FB451DRAFT_1363239 [Mycena latifolia]|nr:hypothetical protein FB451DRAFT_1363239 [Mycena latifolia]
MAHMEVQHRVNADALIFVRVDPARIIRWDGGKGCLTYREREVGMRSQTPVCKADGKAEEDPTDLATICLPTYYIDDKGNITSGTRAQFTATRPANENTAYRQSWPRLKSNGQNEPSFNIYSVQARIIRFQAVLPYLRPQGTREGVDGEHEERAGDRRETQDGRCVNEGSAGREGAAAVQEGKEQEGTRQGRDGQVTKRRGGGGMGASKEKAGEGATEERSAERLKSGEEVYAGMDALGRQEMRELAGGSGHEAEDRRKDGER